MVHATSTEAQAASIVPANAPAVPKGQAAATSAGAASMPVWDCDVDGAASWDLVAKLEAGPCRSTWPGPGTRRKRLARTVARTPGASGLIRHWHVPRHTCYKNTLLKERRNRARAPESGSIPVHIPGQLYRDTTLPCNPRGSYTLPCLAFGVAVQHALFAGKPSNHVK